MLVESYKEFSLTERVKVKKEVIYGFLLSNIDPSIASEQFPVIDYVIHNKNILTIAAIEYNSHLILPAYFSFEECEGSLYYGQFSKFFPTFYIFNPSDFEG